MFLQKTLDRFMTLLVCAVPDQPILQDKNANGDGFQRYLVEGSEQSDTMHIIQV
jgi:hypothetical protein